MKVLVADDHPVLRKGVIGLLSDAFGPIEAGEAGTAPEAVGLLRRRKWDVVILDWTMPGGGGLEVLREATATRPDLPVIVLSMHPEDRYAVRAMRAGAAGYVVKDAAGDELVAAVRKVLAGGTYVSGHFAEQLAGLLKQGRDEALPHETLSDREFEVMILLADGKTITQVADELSLSVKTASTYRSRFCRKMCLETNADLARYAIQHGLLE